MKGKFLLSVLILILLSSCNMLDFHKRKYMPGHYHEKRSNVSLASEMNINRNDLEPAKELSAADEQKIIKEKNIHFGGGKSFYGKVKKDLNLKRYNKINIHSAKKENRKEWGKLKSTKEGTGEEEKQINKAFALTMVGLLSLLLLVMVYIVVNETLPIVILYVIHFLSVFIGFFKARSIKRKHKDEHVKGEHYSGKGKQNISLFFGYLYLAGLVAFLLYGLVLFFIFIGWD